jgi:hypothetical protein
MVTTFDLSITKNKDWIKKRELLWRPVSDALKENLRKKELDGVKHYFMTGEELPGHKMGDGASFSWFPIQTPESWDYLFEHVIKNPKEFEDRFYF